MIRKNLQSITSRNLLSAKQRTTDKEIYTIRKQLISAEDNENSQRNISSQDRIHRSQPTNFNRIQDGAWLKVLQPLFTKLAKFHISAQFFVRVYVSGW